MPAGRIPIRRLSEIGHQQIGDFFAYLSERTPATTRDGKPYFSCKFRDAKRTATAMVWGDSDLYAECERDWLPGGFYKLRATYEDHRQYGPSLAVHRVRAVTPQDRDEGFHEADLLEVSRFDPAAMLEELQALATASIVDEPLRALTLLLLETHRDELMRLPASPKHYYPFPGGWLEHTLAVTKICLSIVEPFRERYPALNRDLVVAGAVLHEIGRAVELAPGPTLVDPVGLSMSGQIFGHLALGRDLVRDAGRTIEGLDPELLMLLEHIVQAHLVRPEWGSPRQPVIPEVLLLHHIDDLDAKFEMYTRCLRNDMTADRFTARDPILGRQLLKREVKEKSE